MARSLSGCRLSLSPWPATAGPAPPPGARCRAPGTAGRCGCRTAGRGCGRPGSANRRSAGARIGIVRPWPAAANVAFVKPRSGRDADLPGPARLPAHWCHRPWPGCRAPTNPPRWRARPSRSRMAPVHRTPRRKGIPGRGWSGRRPDGARGGGAAPWPSGRGEAASGSNAILRRHHPAWQPSQA
jgi:hypothetical protein